MMQHDDLSDWPTLLQRFAAVIGPERTLELARKAGGLDRVHIPLKPTKTHPWSKLLTATEWAAVCAAFGGEKVRLPRGVYVELRKRQIMEMAAQGVPHGKIALHAQVTERYVRRVLSGLGMPKATDERQMGLFGADDER